MSEQPVTRLPWIARVLMLLLCAFCIAAIVFVVQMMRAAGAVDWIVLPALLPIVLAAGITAYLGIVGRGIKRR